MASFFSVTNLQVVTEIFSSLTLRVPFLQKLLYTVLAQVLSFNLFQRDPLNVMEAHIL